MTSVSSYTTELNSEDQTFLSQLQEKTFRYFVEQVNPKNGLVRDTTRTGSHASIAAMGMALASYPVGVERGYIERAEALGRIRILLRFLRDAPQGEAADATGHRGFFYHFLDMESGRRAWKSELSTIDSAILFAGALTSARFFDGASAAEVEVRELANELYERVDWAWATTADDRISHGWKPESGFLPYHWGGYNEALLLMVLALGSPTHPVKEAAYARWLETYSWKKVYGHEFVYCGPLFTHQMSHIWIDFRDIQDAYMREKGIDYFENSRRATLIQREYGKRNPRGFRGYSEDSWGITASDGPGPAAKNVDGRERGFWAYHARGVPWGPDDGTLSPWGTAASLPFAPTEVARALRNIDRIHPELTSRYGFKCSVNATFPDPEGEGDGWVAKGYYGLDQGPVVLMIENCRSELVWRLMRGCPYIRTGLARAGFKGGWLAHAD